MRTIAGLALLAVTSLSLAACGSDDSGTDNDATDATSTSAGASSEGTVCGESDASGDLLARICEEGTITMVAYPEFKPQSVVDEQTGEWDGFDIDVDEEIARRLGVEDIEYVTPSWDVLTAGSWNGRWDMGGGSMAKTPDREEYLYFAGPYYYNPAIVVVHKDNTSVNDLSTDLDGSDIGITSGTIYEDYFAEDFEMEGFSGDYLINDVEVHGYESIDTALQDLALGDGVRLDALVTDLTAAKAWIADGKPVRVAGDPLWYEPVAIAFDKNSPDDSNSLYEAVDQIIADMHEDGTLSELSEQWFDGTDLTVKQ